MQMMESGIGRKRGNQLRNSEGGETLAKSPNFNSPNQPPDRKFAPKRENRNQTMLGFPRTQDWKTFSLYSFLSFLSLTADPTQGSSGLSAGAIAGIVVGCVAGVALIAALAYFLYFRKTGR